MTSCGPYHEVTNLTHMWNKGDYRGNPNGPFWNPNSITGVLYNTPGFSKIYRILDRAGLSRQYDNIVANFTFFAPQDRYLDTVSDAVWINMDRGTAYTLVRSLTLNHRIPYMLLADNPIGLYDTLSVPNKLFITNLNGEMQLNNSIVVNQGDIECDNGIIMTTKGMTWPEFDIGDPQW